MKLGVKCKCLDKEISTLENELAILDNQAKMYGLNGQNEKLRDTTMKIVHKNKALEVINWYILVKPKAKKYLLQLAYKINIINGNKLSSGRYKNYPRSNTLWCNKNARYKYKSNDHTNGKIINEYANW